MGRSASHFESPFSSSALAAPCMFEEAMGGGNRVGMKVGHSRFLCSSQAKQQAYSNLDEWWETLTFDRWSVATCAPYLYVTPQPSLHTAMFTYDCILSLFFGPSVSFVSHHAQVLLHWSAPSFKNMMVSVRSLDVVSGVNHQSLLRLPIKVRAGNATVSLQRKWARK